MTSLDKLEALAKAAIGEGATADAVREYFLQFSPTFSLKLVAAVRAAITVDKMHGDQDSHEFRALRAALEEVDALRNQQGTQES